MAANQNIPSLPSDPNAAPPPLPCKRDKIPGSLICGIAGCIGVLSGRYLFGAGFLGSLMFSMRGWDRSANLVFYATMILLKVLRPLFLALAMLGMILARSEWKRQHNLYSIIGTALCVLALWIAFSNLTRNYFF
jgi:hypothetical protein